jgi:hypothetical protein
MKHPKKPAGFAIALAWPQTYCKQPGSWYDNLALLFGFNHNNYYKVGHAALVLVDVETQTAHYFDFGRYHAPYGHGRVRSAETDHDLKMRTTPIVSSDGLRLENYRDILRELQTNPACHGEGELHASYCRVDFKKAMAKVQQMIEFGPIPYGPFRYKSSNCSRFVNTAILAGKPNIIRRARLLFNVPLTPTPVANVNALNNKIMWPKLLQSAPFCPIQKLDRALLLSTLPQPERHPTVPANAQWLSGEGAGSWFAMELDGTQLKVTRYSPHGVVECNGLYENITPNTSPIDLKNAKIDFPSNCKMVSIKVDNSKVRYTRAK